MSSTARTLLLLVTLTAYADLSSANMITSFSPSLITAPDARAFSNSTVSGNLVVAGLSDPPIASPYNFLDTWNFTLAPDALVTSFVGTINFTDTNGAVTTGITNLQMNLIDLSNSSSIQGWTSAIAFTGAQQLFSVIAPTNFSAGNYALNVRGTLVGPVSSYAGTLQAINPVPLPAAAWLMVSGVGALGAAGRRRKTK